MKSSKKRLYYTMLIFFAIFFLAACNADSSNTAANNNGQSNSDNGETSEEDKYGGTVKIRQAGMPRSIGWLPAMTPPTSILPMAQPAMETLGRYNPDGTMGPWLAKDWELDPDNNQITVYLQENVRFHDGTDFNAEAVKFNLDLAMQEERPLSANLESVEVVDEHTVIFHLSEWSSSLLDDIFWIYPMMSPTAAKEMGEELSFNPVGTGPFKFDSFQNDVFIKYVRNDDYWIEGLPYLDSIEMSIIVDNNTALNSFLAKEVDINLNMPGDVIADYADTTDFDIVEPITRVGLSGIGYVANSSDPNSPLSDVRVRKAISYAINKEEIADVLFKGYVIPSTQLGAPGDANYNPNIESFEHNPEKAKQLLIEAGYPDGFRTQITGQPTEQIVLQAIQGYLAAVGIELDINIVDRAKFNAMAMQEGWDGLISYIYTTQNDMASLLNAHFGPRATIWGSIIGSPPELIDLLEIYNFSTDAQERIELAHQIQKVFVEDHHLASLLYINNTPYMKHKHVMDDGTFTSRGQLFTPEKMWIKK